MREACCPKPLAEGSIVRIEHCASCGTLSFHFGPVTLRLDTRAAESLHETLGRALSELQRRQGLSPPSRAHGRFGRLSS